MPYDFQRFARTLLRSPFHLIRLPASGFCSVNSILRCRACFGSSAVGVDRVGPAAAPPAPVDGSPSSATAASSFAGKRCSPLWSSGNPEYDVFIVGGGVTGSALLYNLTAFTNVQRVGLVERRSDCALVASGPNNNSQTIHCGDIETNYSLEKAATVKRHADMLRNYATKLPTDIRDTSIVRMQKMVLGVGEEECAKLEARYTKFKALFPRMELANKGKIRKLEPSVVQITNHRERHEPLNGIFIEGEHSAVNYYALSHSFLQKARAATDKTVDVRTGTEVLKITRNTDDDTYLVHTNKGTVKARYVVVSACGYSLLIAQQLGYGLKYGCLPVAGSFYFTHAPALNGKVYTVQDPRLPFAAIHGDPDICKKGYTRLGPTALPLMLLERYNLKSFKDYLKVSKLDLKFLTVMLHLFQDPVMLRFALRNFVFELPYLGIRTFLKDAQKILPGLTVDDLVYAKGYGGVRPQLVDKKAMQIVMGEGKILGHNIIFNITPSPGGTTCLGNGEEDMRRISQTLGLTVNEDKLRQTLFEGEYPIDYL